MPQIVNTNIASLNAQRNLNRSQSSLSTSLQRISSGLRVNSAKDDAAGQYLKTLKTELDAFVGNESGLTHEVRGVRAEGSAMLSISLVKGAAPQPTLENADNPTAEALASTRENLLRQHSQWLYFERCLRIYEKGTMYLFKPLEMIHWTRRQAILDAQEVIAETLESQGR